ncbi:MAG: cell division protein MraZ [Phycisphaerales bacterium]|nr:cell division protein MraZ [Phycisphaerales bacterium]MDB5302670.1 cell division protein MraZ [Phycisphaerales bacterium]
MRHLLLFGSYDLTIDDKNRMLIPAEIRKSIVPERDGEAFFLIVGINRKPWLYPERYYEELVFQQTPEITPGEEALAFDQMNFAMASKVEWDKQGRILVPDKTLKRTETSKEVTLAGARDHLELWNRADWAAREEELDRQRVEIALRAKQARQQPGTATSREG